MKRGPQYKICRRLGDSVHPKCETQKFQIAQAKKGRGRTRRFSRRSEYGTGLLEKQKIRFAYNISERQFENCVARAEEDVSGRPIEALYRDLERRLDNIIYRAGFASSRPFARQVVNHGHVLVGGRKISIPSYRAQVGDVISVRPASSGNRIFASLAERTKDAKAPAWLSVDGKKQTITVRELPRFDDRTERTLDFDAALLFYSRA